MSKNNKTTLVISPYLDLRFEISGKMAMAGLKDVIVLSTVQELENSLSEFGNLDLVIYDFNLGKGMITEAMGKVRVRFPDVRLVLISNNKISDEVEDLNPWKVVITPINTSDVNDVFIDTLVALQSQEKGDEVRESIVDGTRWEQIEEKDIRIYMSRILLELDAQEAIIYSHEGKLIYTENIENTDIGVKNNEYRVLLNDLSQRENGEVLRIIKIDSSDYLVHGSILKGNIVLGLIFSIDTPFSLVRKQSWYFRERITELNTINHDTVIPKHFFTQGNWKFDRRSEYALTVPPKKFLPSLATTERKNSPVTESRKIVNSNSQAVQ